MFQLIKPILYCYSFSSVAFEPSSNSQRRSQPESKSALVGTFPVGLVDSQRTSALFNSDGSESGKTGLQRFQRRLPKSGRAAFQFQSKLDYVFRRWSRSVAHFSATSASETGYGIVGSGPRRLSDPARQLRAGQRVASVPQLLLTDD